MVGAPPPPGLREDTAPVFPICCWQTLWLCTADRHTLQTADRGKQDKEDFWAFLLVGWKLRNASATLSKHIQKLLMSSYAAQTHCVLLSFFTVSINPPKAAA